MRRQVCFVYKRSLLIVKFSNKKLMNHLPKFFKQKAIQLIKCQMFSHQDISTTADTARMHLPGLGVKPSILLFLFIRYHKARVICTNRKEAYGNHLLH